MSRDTWFHGNVTDPWQSISAVKGLGPTGSPVDEGVEEDHQAWGDLLPGGGEGRVGGGKEEEETR